MAITVSSSGLTGTVLSSSCNTGISNSHAPLYCFYLNIRHFSNTSFLFNKKERRIKYCVNVKYKYWL